MRLAIAAWCSKNSPMLQNSSNIKAATILRWNAASTYTTDPDYRGMVGVLLFNHGHVDFHVRRGDRVAQLVLERISTPDVIECHSLEVTKRSDGGFGSTGQW